MDNKRQEITRNEKYLTKDKLVVGKTYICEARNFDEAVWNGEAFVGRRVKFGSVCEDTEYHWDDGEPYGTVKPLYEK
ncbi:hypothetical protein [uncultured Photobacterium sp.]|uniref:hypothetical protein n=1 Tax=uncultured Photobacterium sp. TaxID=173973 RepID=UPI0026279AB1|nr:hypothetical protein [uncultured Photobacterium sp.]